MENINIIYIDYWNKIRNRQLAIYKQNLIRAKLGKIARYIAAGGSTDDPDIKDDYNYLVTELGEEAVLTEINGYYLIKEED